MNALAEYVATHVDDIELRELEQRIPGRDVSWINASFNRWGEWIWKHRDFEGYPTSDAVAAFLHGFGGGIGGHRILCKDPPKWFLLTHALWLMLSEGQREAVYAEYVPGVADDGHLWSRQEKCAILKLTEEAFRKRLQRARIRIWEWSRKSKS